jgi:1,4-dihydroxy-2-naphthoate polyprenyltransferase
MNISPWILAARPKTLPAAVVPVWVGAMPWLVDGDALTGSWLLFALTLASCLCIQVATNLFNDAIDHRKGADTADRLGPTRVTAAGLLSPQAVMTGALLFCGLAAALAIPLILERGWPIVLIGLVSLYFAYGYTGGPLPLAYRGLGELFVIVFFGFVAVSGSAFVQSDDWNNRDTWLYGAQCGLYSAILIAINNLRDIDEDRSTGKRTLAVRFGPRFARFEIGFMGSLALYLQSHGLGNGMLLGLLGLIFIHALIAIAIQRTPPGPIYNRYLGFAALQLLLFALFVTLREAYA